MPQNLYFAPFAVCCVLKVSVILVKLLEAHSHSDYVSPNYNPENCCVNVYMYVCKHQTDFLGWSSLHSETKAVHLGSRGQDHSLIRVFGLKGMEAVSSDRFNRGVKKDILLLCNSELIPWVHKGVSEECHAKDREHRARS